MATPPRQKILPHLDARRRRLSEDEDYGADRVRTRWRKAITGGVMLIALFAAYPAVLRIRPQDGATTRVTASHRLAADPLDTQRIAPGVAREKLDIAQAEIACTDAVKRQPANNRVLYQLGRVLFDEGQYARGLDAMRHSASAGYPQSQFALGALASQGNHVPQDICEGGRWWIKAARQPHLYAKIYLAKGWLDDTFRGCQLSVTPGEIAAFIVDADSLAVTPEEKADLAAVKAEWNAKVGDKGSGATGSFLAPEAFADAVKWLIPSGR